MKHIVKVTPGKSVYLSNQQWVDLTETLHQIKDLSSNHNHNHNHNLTETWCDAFDKLLATGEQVVEDLEIIAQGDDAIDEANGVSY